MMQKNLTPSLTVKTAEPTDGVEIMEPYGKLWLSRDDWDALCDDIITAYKEDPAGYELYKATR